MQVFGGGPDFVAIIARGDIFRARFHRRFEDLFLAAGLGRVEDEAEPVEAMRNAALGAKIAAVLRKGGAHGGGGAVAIVGQRLDDDRAAARAVAFVTHFLIAFAVLRAGLVDRALDVVLGHRLRLGGIDGQPQARVHVGIGHAHFRRHGDFAAELGKHRAALLVLRALAMHDVLEFGMAGHGFALRS